MFKFLILAGVSGSGKSHLANLLCEEYGEIFYKVRQVTTRKKRPSENNNDYLFLSEEEYDEMKDSLVGKTEVNGTRYGSILSEEDAQDRIGVIILNEKGILDFEQYFDKTDYISIGLNRKIEHLEVTREGRDEAYLQGERKVLDLCDYVINLEKGKYSNPHIIKNMVLTHFNQHFDRVEVFASEYQCTTTVYEGNKVVTMNDILVEKDFKDFSKSVMTLHSNPEGNSTLDNSSLLSLAQSHAEGLSFMNLSSRKKVLH